MVATSLAAARPTPVQRRPGSRRGAAPTPARAAPRRAGGSPGTTGRAAPWPPSRRAPRRPRAAAGRTRRPATAGRPDVDPVGRLVDAPLAAQLEPEVLDGVGDVERARVDAGLVDRLAQQAGRPGRRTAGPAGPRCRRAARRPSPPGRARRPGRRPPAWRPGRARSPGSRGAAAFSSSRVSASDGMNFSAPGAVVCGHGAFRTPFAAPLAPGSPRQARLATADRRGRRAVGPAARRAPSPTAG